jgi:hypothetical protein
MSLSNFCKLTVRKKERKKEIVQHRWFIRLWFLIESIIGCGMCPFRLISQRPSAFEYDAFHSRVFFTFCTFHIFLYVVALLFFILRVYWLSLSFNSLRCLFYTLSHQLMMKKERKKSSRQSRELEVFSFISRLTVKIPKALRDQKKPKYSISTCVDTGLFLLNNRSR